MINFNLNLAVKNSVHYPRWNLPLSNKITCTGDVTSIFNFSLDLKLVKFLFWTLITFISERVGQKQKCFIESVTISSSWLFKDSRLDHLRMSFVFWREHSLLVADILLLPFSHFSFYLSTLPTNPVRGASCFHCGRLRRIMHLFGETIVFRTVLLIHLALFHLWCVCFVKNKRYKNIFQI